MKRRWFRRGRKLTSPDGLPVVALPAAYAQMIQLYGLRGTYSGIYRSQPNVRAILDLLAEACAGIKLKVFQKVPTSPMLPSGHLELEDHEMAELLNHPAPGMARSRFWADTVTDYFIHNVAFWQKIRQQGEVVALLRQPPTALTPERDPFTRMIRSYKTTLGTTLSLDDLVVFHGYDPELHDGNVSPLETLRRTLAEEYAAGRNRENMWRNATRKDGIVERPLEAPDWSWEQEEAWRVEWEGSLSGEGNSSRVALLKDGMKWNDSSWSPEESQYIEGRKLNRQEVAALFRVDPRLVGASDEKPDKEVRTAFYVDRLVPLLRRFSDEIDAQLLPDFEPFNSSFSIYSAFNIDAKLKGSFEEQAKILVMTRGGPLVTMNEARARLDLPPLSGGDDMILPMNVTTGGQASPMSPHETPGDMPALGQTPGPGTLPRAAIAVSMTPEELVWIRGLIANQNGHAPETVESVLEKHLTRVGEAIRRKAGAIKGPAVFDDLWDVERWDRELAADLQAIGIGEEEARQRAASVNVEARARLAKDLEVVS